MGVKKAVKREKRGKPSHREDLQSELLTAACAFVARHGHDALSIRRLAQEVGVTSGAPYHHFQDRRALLLAVALEGYRRMFEADDAAVQGAATPYECVYRSCHSFLRFAAENPRLFTLMYESELVRPHLAPEIERAHDQGYLRLRTEAARVSAGLTPRERSVRISTLWCALFGFALQRGREMLRAPASEPEPQKLADAVIRQALRLLTD